MSGVSLQILPLIPLPIAFYAIVLDCQLRQYFREIAKSGLTEFFVTLWLFFSIIALNLGDGQSISMYIYDKQLPAHACAGWNIRKVETAAGAHRPTSRTPGKQCDSAGGVFSPSRDLGFYELLPKLKEPVNFVG